MADRGGLMRVTPYGAATQRRAVMPEGGGGVNIPNMPSAWEAMATPLLALSQQFNAVADRIASEKALQEGVAAGMAGETEARVPWNAANRTYNEAMRQSMAARMNVAGMREAERLETEFFGQPERIAAEFEAWRTGVVQEMQSVAPGYAVQFSSAMETQEMQAVARAKEVARRQAQDRATAALVENEGATVSELQKAGAGLASPDEEVRRYAMHSLNQTIEAYMSQFDRTDAQGRPLFTEEAKAKMKVAAQDVYSSAAYRAYVANAPTIQEKAARVSAITRGDVVLDLQAMSFRDGVGVGGMSPAQIDRLVGAVEFAESGGRIDAVSPVGAAGPMQVMPGTARDYARKMGDKSLDGLSDEQVRARLKGEYGRKMGRTILLDNLQQFDGDVEAALIAYNAGPGNARKFLKAKRAGAADPYTALPKASETKPYVARVMRRMGVPAGGDAEVMGKVPALGGGLGGAAALGTGLSSDARERLINAIGADLQAQVTAEKEARTQREAELKKFQDLNSASFQARILSNDPAERPTVAEIEQQVEIGGLSAETARALMRATVEASAEKSDADLMRDLYTRIAQGEDVSNYAMENKNRLTFEDYGSVLSRNRTAQDAGARLTEYQSQMLTGLMRTIVPEGWAPSLDQGAPERQALARAEFLDRVKTENAEDVMNDLIARSRRLNELSVNRQVQRLIVPRFAVLAEDGKTVRVEESGRALKAAQAEGRITDSDYRRQIRILMRWKDFSDELQRGSVPVDEPGQGEKKTRAK